MAKLALKSVEDVSVLRKFSIFFILLSVVPFIFLVVLFFILYLSGDIKIESKDLIGWTFFIVGFFLFISFFAIRKTLIHLNSISKTLKVVLNGEIPKQIAIKEAGDNEIAQIARSFNEIVRKLEENIRDMERSKSMLQDLLTKIASGVSFMDNVEAFLDLIIKTTVGALNAKTGLLLLSLIKTW